MTWSSGIESDFYKWQDNRNYNTRSTLYTNTEKKKLFVKRQPMIHKLMTRKWNFVTKYRARALLYSSMTTIHTHWICQRGDWERTWKRKIVVIFFVVAFRFAVFDVNKWVKVRQGKLWTKDSILNINHIWCVMNFTILQYFMIQKCQMLSNNDFAGVYMLLADGTWYLNQLRKFRFYLNKCCDYH